MDETPMLQRLQTKKRAIHGRALVSAIAIAVFTLSVTLLSTSPANAADAGDAGFLRIKGPGSTYTRADTVTMTGLPGAKVTFGIQVVNGDSVPAQYRVHVGPEGGTTNTNYTASKSLMTNWWVGVGYYTTQLAPGAAESLTFTVTIPTDINQDQGLSVYKVELYSPYSGHLLTTSYLGAAQSRADTSGATTLTATANGQKPIGGLYPDQTVTAQPVAYANGTASFSVTLKNPSKYPQNKWLHVDKASACVGWGPLAVKSGLTDVTSAATSADGLPVHLNASSSKTYTITVTSVKAYCYSQFIHVDMLSYDGSDFLARLLAVQKDPR